MSLSKVNFFHSLHERLGNLTTCTYLQIIMEHLDDTSLYRLLSSSRSLCHADDVEFFKTVIHKYVHARKWTWLLPKVYLNHFTPLVAAARNATHGSAYLIQMFKIMISHHIPDRLFVLGVAVPHQQKVWETFKLWIWKTYEAIPKAIAEHDFAASDGIVAFGLATELNTREKKTMTTTTLCIALHSKFDLSEVIDFLLCHGYYEKIEADHTNHFYVLEFLTQPYNPEIEDFMNAWKITQEQKLRWIKTIMQSEKMQNYIRNDPQQFIATVITNAFLGVDSSHCIYLIDQLDRLLNGILNKQFSFAKHPNKHMAILPFLVDLLHTHYIHEISWRACGVKVIEYLIPKVDLTVPVIIQTAENKKQMDLLVVILKINNDDLLHLLLGHIDGWYKHKFHLDYHPLHYGFQCTASFLTVELVLQKFPQLINCSYDYGLPLFDLFFVHFHPNPLRLMLSIECLNLNAISSNGFCILEHLGYNWTWEFSEFSIKEILDDSRYSIKKEQMERVICRYLKSFQSSDDDKIGFLEYKEWLLNAIETLIGHPRVTVGIDFDSKLMAKKLLQMYYFFGERRYEKIENTAYKIMKGYFQLLVQKDIHPTDKWLPCIPPLLKRAIESRKDTFMEQYITLHFVEV